MTALRKQKEEVLTTVHFILRIYRSVRVLPNGTSEPPPLAQMGALALRVYLPPSSSSFLTPSATHPFCHP